MAWNKKGGGYDPALYKSGIYLSWTNMKTRCTNEASPRFSDYGGRGIAVCKEWETFVGFYADMGGSYRKGLTLERKENDKGYSKDNCIWASPKAQANNRKSNKWFTFNGETKTLEQWIELRGLKSSTVRQRYYVYKWPIERALEVTYR